MKQRRILVLYAVDPSGNTLSYQTGWPAHLRQSPLFSATLVNLWSLTWENVLGLALKLRYTRFDAAVILHSAFSNASYVKKIHRLLLRLSGLPVAYFVGNEYKLMPEKMAMCEEVGVKLLVTMNPDSRAQQLYRQRLGAKVISMPSAGVDTATFQPRKLLRERHIDIGYRAYDDPIYFLHNDSRKIADFFLDYGPRNGLSLDVSLDPSVRFDTAGWADFLNNCRGQIGVERGPDVFELTDNLRHNVIEYLKDHVDATSNEITERFSREVSDPIPARMISGRHTEAAACKTVQILFPGRYNDYFEPDRHYIPLAKDFSNIDEVMSKFRDDAYCKRIADAAYELVMSELTFDRLIRRFATALADIVP